MPQCFQLFRKGSDKAESLNKVDEELCALLRQPVHPRRYVNGWFDIIGYRIACGKSWEEIRMTLYEDKIDDFLSHIDEEDGKEYNRLGGEYWHWTNNLLSCLDYLETHFTTNAWYQVGK